MDTLSYMLQTVRMRAALYASVRPRPPWGIGIPRLDAAAFHAVVSGRCWLRLDGEDSWLHLAPGDVVVLPHGHAHAFCDQPGSPVRLLSHLSADPGSLQPPQAPLELPGSGPQTTVLCGHLWFDDPAASPLVGMLPPLLHFRAGAGGRPATWLGPVIQFLALETHAQAPGSHATLARLSDVIVIQAIRAHIAQLPDSGNGWLRALADPQLGQALTLIHQQPETPWTVPALAARAGLSRSTFTARFAELTGEPPLRYLTRWRMHHAQRLLRTGHPTVAQVAARVGYQTEQAFSRAFTRWVGITPGAFSRDSTVAVRPAAALGQPSPPLPPASSGSITAAGKRAEARGAQPA